MPLEPRLSPHAGVPVELAMQLLRMSEQIDRKTGRRWTLSAMIVWARKQDPDVKLDLGKLSRILVKLREQRRSLVVAALRETLSRVMLPSVKQLRRMERELALAAKRARIDHDADALVQIVDMQRQIVATYAELGAGVVPLAEARVPTSTINGNMDYEGLTRAVLAAALAKLEPPPPPEK